MYDALCGEIARVHAEGFDPALFERQKKASLGGRIRALSNFSGLAVGTIAGRFNGFRALDGFDVLASITCGEADAWVKKNLVPERFAMSVVYPKEA